jgi:small-conductance mechanosensitive channel
VTDFLAEMQIWQRIVVVLFVVLVAHGLVGLIRMVSGRAMSSEFATHINKARTAVRLATSTLIFVLYFAAVGFALSELGVPLTTYFASASIIGLAIAFGAQGFVQDVVSGLTTVFSGLFDIGDVVEISGQVGIVDRFGLRYTVLRNPLGAEILVPNRSILNVVIYSRGYVRCLVDLVLPAEEEIATKIEAIATDLASAAREQFPGIHRAPSEITGPHKIKDGKTFLRIKFRIWPGRGALIEGYFKQDLLQEIRQIVPDYADWMVTVNYEVESYTPLSSARRRGSR